MVNISDVAAEAGVSTATVSRVINNHSRVDQGLAARVNEAVDRLGYRANPLGRALRRQRTPIWGFIASGIDSPFSALLFHGLEDKALEHGRLLMVCSTNADVEREHQYVQMALEHRFGGLVIAAASMTAAAFDPLVRNNTPVVLVDRFSSTYPEMDSVMVDNRAGAHAAVTHLLAKGYRRIGAIAGPVTASTAVQRREGYEAALTDHGAVSDPRLVVVGDFSARSGYEAVTRLLARDEPPDGLFVANGQMAVGAFAAVRDLGVEMPGRLGFVTFDDDSWMTLVDPPITVVHQPAYEMGKAAADILLRREQNLDEGDSRPGTHRVLAPELIIRESSGGPGFTA